MNLANYIHACFYSATPNALNRAIKNKQLLTWPGIEKINFVKFTEDNVAMRMGHLNQEQKGLRSTKISEQPIHLDTEPREECKQYEIM